MEPFAGLRVGASAAGAIDVGEATSGRTDATVATDAEGGGAAIETHSLGPGASAAAAAPADCLG